MNKLKASLAKKALQAHRVLLWTAAITIVFYAMSGLSHTVMTWTTPQGKMAFPPTLSSPPEGLENLSPILQKAGIQQSVFLKIVPFQGQAVLQVTEKPLEPSRYFDLKSQEEIRDGDRQQALALAEHYLQQAPADVVNVEFQNQFDKDYPWVNRLLPIYKVRFQSGQVAYIHTESASLVTIGTDLKTTQQAFFMNLHSFDWLKPYPIVRFTVMFLMVLSLGAMALSGLMLLWKMKHQRKMESSRRGHRVLAYIVVLPLLGFSISGIARLLMNDFSPRTRGALLKEAETLDFSKLKDLQTIHYHSTYSSISLIQFKDNYYLRFAVPGGAPGEHVHREAKFAGHPTEVGAQIFSLNGEPASFKEVDFSREQVLKNWPSAKILSEETVRSFGPYYDFRNKRLPAWKFDIEVKKGGPQVVFVDPATGIVVDRLTGFDKAEALLFGTIHKWNAIVPLVGRLTRDLFIVSILLVSLILTGLGVYLFVAKKRKI